jgi:hypothetical protein
MVAMLCCGALAGLGAAVVLSVGLLKLALASALLPMRLGFGVVKALAGFQMALLAALVVPLAAAVLAVLAIPALLVGAAVWLAVHLLAAL